MKLHPIPFLALLVAACGTSSEASGPSQRELLEKAQELGVRNVRAPFPGVLTAGQFDPAQFNELVEAGVHTFVNLRVPTEEGTGWEAEKASELGVDYVSIPIAGIPDVTEANARHLSEVVDAAAKPVMVYCGSSNRVGALFALKAHYVDGESPEQSIEIGKSAGMTRLEPEVRAVLGM